MVRIFTACHGTQLLVIQHLRRHLQRPQAREYLLWSPMENIPSIDNFMHNVISTADFNDTLDMRAFESLQQRTQSPVSWWFESARRLRRDAATVHTWMKENQIAEDEIELWADDPIHFNVFFLRGLLQKARHVKIPHCFNLEDDAACDFKKRLETGWRAVSKTKKFLFQPWQRWASGIDLRIERCVYDCGYTFDQPSCWSKHSIDVSDLVSIEAFNETFRTLPSSLRKEIEGMAHAINNGRRPLIILMLFGLDSQARQVYQKSVSRIFSERNTQLRDCSLAVKVHPASRGVEEGLFFEWLKTNIPAQVFPIQSPLNLEFMLSQLNPNYVWAGPCGSLPIIKRLQTGQPIVLPEVTEYLLRRLPDDWQAYRSILTGLEAW